MVGKIILFILAISLLSCFKMKKHTLVVSSRPSCEAAEKIAIAEADFFCHGLSGSDKVSRYITNCYSRQYEKGYSVRIKFYCKSGR